MNNGGDAAEQVVRMSLEGLEVAMRITGSGAKNLAFIIAAALKEEQKTAGRSRLANMLKSGKELTVFSLPQKDIGKFTKEAKKYGVLYCVVKDKHNKDENTVVDIITRAEDAPKIDRLVKRFKLASVSEAKIVHEAKGKDNANQESIMDKVDSLIEEAVSGPQKRLAEKSHLSGNSLEGAKVTQGTMDKTSVREKINEYKAKAESGKEVIKDMAANKTIGR